MTIKKFVSCIPQDHVNAMCPGVCHPSCGSNNVNYLGPCACMCGTCPSSHVEKSVKDIYSK